MSLALVLAALVAAAPQRGLDPTASILRGTVVDAATAAPVVGARVSLAGSGTWVLSGPDGGFEFGNLRPGGYALTVSTVGYIFVRRHVDLPFNTVVVVTVPLTEGTGAYQDAVTVTPEAHRPPALGVASQSELGSAALQDLRGVAADDPMRALQALPGAATDDDFQAQFSVRGAAFRNVGIVTDDMATPLLLHQVQGASDTGSIAMINTDVISRATLLAGPQPQRDGDWTGATMTFDLREGSRDRTALRAAVSGTSASAVLEGPIGRAHRGSWIVSIRKSYIDWLIRRIEPSIGSTIGFADTQSKIAFDLTSRQQIQAVLIGGIGDYEQTQTGATNGLASATSRSGLAAVAWRYTAASTVVTQRVSVVTSDFRDRGVHAQELGRGVTRSYVWRGDVTHTLGGHWTAEGGARVEADRDDQTLRNFRLASGVLKVASAEVLGADDTIAGLWGQVARRTEAGGLAAGVRVANASLGPWRTVSPWLLAERTLGAFTLRGGVGDAAQFPDTVAVEAARRSLTPTPMAPEHAVSVDAGVEHRVTAAWRWRITAFHRDDAQVLRPLGEARRLPTGLVTAASTFPLLGAELTGSSRGVDVVVERRAAGGLSGWIGYTWAHTRYRDTVTGETFDGDFDQRHTLNVFVQQRLSYRWAVSAKLRVGSNVPIVGYFAGTPASLALGTSRNQVRLPVYARLDLRANRTFTFNQRRLTLFVEVMNATGRENMGQASGQILSGGQTQGFVERMIPRIPSAGLLIEF